MRYKEGIEWLGRLDRAHRVYSGASSAWKAIESGKTASHLMAESVGALELPGRTASSIGLAALFTSIMGVVMMPVVIKAMKG